MKKLTTLSLTLLVCSVGCGSDETNVPDDPCADYSGVSGSPSFIADVMPVLAVSCALSNSCHSNQTNSPAEQLSLGPPPAILPDPAMAMDVINGLVNMQSLRSLLPLVTPGSPEKSWLMAKTHFTSDTFGRCEEQTQCADSAEGCGDLMPLGSSKPMDQPRIDVIAAWIKNGASTP